MKLIQTITVGSGGAANIEFNSIPQTYTDLVLVTSLRSARAAGFEEYRLYFNGANSNLSTRYLEGDGANPASGTTANGYIGIGNSSTSTSNTFSSQRIYIPNYAGSTTKSYSVESVSEANGTTAYSDIVAGLWNQTAAITSITLTNGTGSNWLQYSSASLYGVTKFGESSPKASGGVVTQANGYWIHTFTNSGNFIPSQNLTNVEYLVIAGGGGGGANYGAGGGAGGYRSSVVGESSGGGASAESRLSLTSGTSYAVLVGAGAPGATGYNASTDGSSSVFGSITATGGGGGGTWPGGGGSSIAAGRSGGSGGGGSLNFYSGGSGTTGQGYAGGTGGKTGGSEAGGGGGGAGAVGQAAGTSGGGIGGNGGAGVASSITGTSVTRAGGGGGHAQTTGTAGTGGSGGGGNGSKVTAGTATNGTMSTGSGGGGGGPEFGTGGNGGSGIVIVRYAV